MRVVLFVGGTHRGKTRLIKKFIKGKEHVILDIKDEYKRGFTTFQSTDREEFFKFISEFVGVKKKLGKKICVMEEASFYLSNRHYSTACEKIMVDKWSSKNTFFVVYHSIKKIPDTVYEYADIMYLWKTKDILPKIKKHPEEVIKAFQLVNQKSKRNKHFYTKIILDDID